MDFLPLLSRLTFDGLRAVTVIGFFFSQRASERVSRADIYIYIYIHVYVCIVIGYLYVFFESFTFLFN